MGEKSNSVAVEFNEVKISTNDNEDHPKKTETGAEVFSNPLMDGHGLKTGAEAVSNPVMDTSVYWRWLQEVTSATAVSSRRTGAVRSIDDRFREWLVNRKSAAAGSNVWLIDDPFQKRYRNWLEDRKSATAMDENSVLIEDSRDGSKPKKPKITVSEDSSKIDSSDPASFLAGGSEGASCGVISLGLCGDKELLAQFIQLAATVHRYLSALGMDDGAKDIEDSMREESMAIITSDPQIYFLLEDFPQPQLLNDSHPMFPHIVLWIRTLISGSSPATKLITKLYSDDQSAGNAYCTDSMKLTKFLALNYKAYHLLRILGCQDAARSLISKVNKYNIYSLTSKEGVAMLMEDENDIMA